jgi:eukaryotic-like serine/threonine-protein kinase
MERIYGMDLEEYLKVTKRAINEKTAVGWLSQLVQILQQIHQQGIFHRDIKLMPVLPKLNRSKIILVAFTMVQDKR